MSIFSDQLRNPDTLNMKKSPTIKIWNMFADAIMARVGSEFELKGSVDDLVLDGGNGKCDHCGSDMIRIALEHNYYYRGGAIYCSNWNKNDKHPKKYWIEVWPDINFDLSQEELKKLNQEEQDANAFRLSSPAIKLCYTDHSIFFHNWRESVEKRWNPNYEIKSSPSPSFIHNK